MNDNKKLFKAEKLLLNSELQTKFQQNLAYLKPVPAAKPVVNKLQNTPEQEQAIKLVAALKSSYEPKLKFQSISASQKLVPPTKLALPSEQPNQE